MYTKTHNIHIDKKIKLLHTNINMNNYVNGVIDKLNGQLKRETKQFLDNMQIQKVCCHETWHYINNCNSGNIYLAVVAVLIQRSVCAL